MNGKQPGFYQALKQQYPDLLDAHAALGQLAKDAGPLDDRQGQLIQLAAAVAARSEGAVHSHTRRALAAGATPAEINHAIILLISTVGFPSVSAGLSWAADILED